MVGRQRNENIARIGIQKEKNAQNKRKYELTVREKNIQI